MINKVVALVILVWVMIVMSQQKFIVQSPPQLKSQIQNMFPQGIVYSVANYGQVPFGKSLTGIIYVNQFNENCQYQQDGSENVANKIVISTRGDCTFTTKSINSQKQGAKLAIIADNIKRQNPGSIIMVDDGKGPQVKIPTILISYEVGMLIIQYIQQNQNINVSVSVSFDTYKKDKVQVSLWMSSFDRKSYMLVRDFEPYYTKIKDSIKLSIYHSTIACSTCLQTDCYDTNKYCINTGFYGQINKNYGREVIKQQLREQLIWKYYPNLWWKYIQMFDQQCVERDQIADCSNETMGRLGIEINRINIQNEKSFENVTVVDKGVSKTTITNKILQSNDDLRYKSGLLIFPGVIINNMTYRGNLDALDVFEMVCNSFNNQPDGCSLKIQTKKQSVWKYVIIIIIIFIVALAFLVLCYRRHIRRELSKNLNNEVNQLVSQYITMYEAQRFDNSSPTSQPGK